MDGAGPPLARDGQARAATTYYVLRRVLGVIHRVVGVLHRVLGVIHRVTELP